MKLNKHVMAMNLAAVIAFGAVAGIVAPSVAGNDAIVAFAAETSGDAETGGNAQEKKNAETKGAEVKPAEDAPAAVKEGKLTYNGDGKTATFTEANKKATSVKVPGKFKNAAGQEIEITALDKNAFKGSKAKTIDVSEVALEKLVANQFNGASKVMTLKINGSKLKAKNINKKFVKGLKKLKTIKVKDSAKHYKNQKLAKKLKAAAKLTKYKKGTKVKRY